MYPPMYVIYMICAHNVLGSLFFTARTTFLRLNGLIFKFGCELDPKCFWQFCRAQNSALGNVSAHWIRNNFFHSDHVSWPSPVNFLSYVNVWWNLIADTDSSSVYASRNVSAGQFRRQMCIPVAVNVNSQSWKSSLSINISELNNLINLILLQIL